MLGQASTLKIYCLVFIVRSVIVVSKVLLLFVVKKFDGKYFKRLCCQTVGVVPITLVVSMANSISCSWED